ncbi:Protein-glutamate methylesterase/protein-glutamine glutaminase [Thermoflexales bacterium]|nr:Protein-glutamate methylesterase/protein-glutamine glutaminase [Thermoflexales bacterium]
MTKDIIRVLVVDDSQIMRDILTDMLHEAPGIQVLGTARDGMEAVELTASLRPDVITMDIRMPRLNGLEATRQIMSSMPTPIIVVASNIYEAEMNIAFNATAMGALTVVEKPHGLDAGSYESVRQHIITTIQLMADVQVVALAPNEQVTVRPPQRDGYKPTTPCELIAIAASAGGPGVLREILQCLPADFSLPIVIVQHIARGFGQGFAHWLDSLTPLPVLLAQPGDALVPGRVLLAPEDRHLTLTPGHVVQLDQTEPVKGLRPSATRLFESLAAVYGPAAVGVILSGMGEDGVAGLERLHAAGGHVIAQSEESCVVSDMPKTAVVRGIVDRVLTPGEITSAILQLDGHRKSHAG